MFGEVFALGLYLAVVEDGLVVGEVVLDDGVDVFGEEFADLVFLGVDFVLDGLYAVLLLLGLVLDVLFHRVYELPDALGHKLCQSI